MDVDEAPKLQVIILGSGGGPLETNITAFLARSISSGWRKGSVVAVDAGVHLSAITQILEETQPEGLGSADALPLPHVLQDGPFAGLEVRSSSPAVNAGQIHGDLIDTYLITHPHLDHISGFVINTAGLTGQRPKRLAGLPSTISAFKNHIFNNIIWPNLSDENQGAGLVTYMRLNEGGHPSVGEGDGYMELSDGIAIKVWSVSHGHCIERHQHRGSGSSSRYNSIDAGQGGPAYGANMMSPRGIHHHNTAPNLAAYMQQQSQHHQQQGTSIHERRSSPALGSSAPSIVTQGIPNRQPSMSMGGGHSPTESVCVYDSSAYFIQDVQEKKEVLIFGDVEPDSISLSPRNLQVWQEAAPKIIAGKLAAIFMECSYDDSRAVDRLFGHLTPRFFIEELIVLAAQVEACKAAPMQRTASKDSERGSIKRKREGQDGLSGRLRTSSRPTMQDRLKLEEQESVSPKTNKQSQRIGSQPSEAPAPADTLDLREPDLKSATVASFEHKTFGDLPLKGLTVVIIHIKDKMTDGPDISAQILQELQQHEADVKLGCEFLIAKKGQSYMF